MLAKGKFSTVTKLDLIWSTRYIALEQFVDVS